MGRMEDKARQRDILSCRIGGLVLYAVSLFIVVFFGPGVMFGKYSPIFIVVSVACAVFGYWFRHYPPR